PAREPDRRGLRPPRRLRARRGRHRRAVARRRGSRARADRGRARPPPRARRPAGDRMIALVALLLWLIFGGAGAAPAPPALTPGDSGKTVAVDREGGATLRLSHRWRWSEPRLNGRSIQLQRVDYIRDPGYDEWQIEPLRKGTTTITALGA